MINKIEMKNYVSYNKDGCIIENCKKINFIYGVNGSGKSTISNFLKVEKEMMKNRVI